MAVKKKYECKQIDYGFTFKPEKNVDRRIADMLMDIAGHIGTNLGFDNEVHSSGGTSSDDGETYEEFDVEFNPAAVDVDQMFEELAYVKEAIAQKLIVPFEDKAWLWLTLIDNPQADPMSADLDPATGKFALGDGTVVDIEEVDFIDYNS